MLEGNAAADLRRWTANADPAWLAGIDVMATDLAESFRAGLSPHLDHATRVADPFHVVRIGNRCVDQVRRRVQNETLGHAPARTQSLSRQRTGPRTRMKTVATFEQSIILPVPPERAFDLIGDPQNGPRIDPMIRSYQPEGGVMREGGRNNICGRMFGLPYRAVSETTVWEPPRRMVLDTVKPARPVHMTLTQLFEPHPEGTRLTYRMEMSGTMPGGAVVARAVRWFVARNFRQAVPRVLDLTQEDRGQ